MTRAQHAATRQLHQAEVEWLRAYGWQSTGLTCRWTHDKAPDTRPDYSLRDAVTMTRADLLRYGSAVRSAG